MGEPLQQSRMRRPLAADAEVADRAYQAKATNPMATALATMLKSKVACATSALADHNGSILMVPWVACDTSVMSTLPPVWLNNHEYQNVTATVPRR